MNWCFRGLLEGLAAGVLLSVWDSSRGKTERNVRKYHVGIYRPLMGFIFILTEMGMYCRIYSRGVT